MRAKPILVTVMVVALLVAVGLAGRDGKSSKRAPEPTATTAIIQIEGMSCYSCVARVMKAVKGVNGVIDVDVSLQKRQGEVQYQPTVVTADSVAQVITGLGYRGKVVGQRGAK